MIFLLLLADLGLGLFYFGNYLLGEPSGFITLRFDLNGEANVPTWYSSVKLFSIALLLALFASRVIELSNWRTWLLAGLPLLFLALSADEVAQIHEWLGLQTDALLPDGTRRGTFFRVTGIWMFLIGIPFLIIVLAILYMLREYFRDAAGALKLFVYGLLVLLFGALGIETLSNIPERGSLGYVFQIFFEELFEMLGATLMLWAAYELERKTRPTTELLDNSDRTQQPAQSDG